MEVEDGEGAEMQVGDRSIGVCVFSYFLLPGSHFFFLSVLSLLFYRLPVLLSCLVLLSHLFHFSFLSSVYSLFPSVLSLPSLPRASSLRFPSARSERNLVDS